MKNIGYFIGFEMTPVGLAILTEDKSYIVAAIFVAVFYFGLLFYEKTKKSVAS